MSKLRVTINDIDKKKEKEKQNDLNEKKIKQISNAIAIYNKPKVYAYKQIVDQKR